MSKKKIISGQLTDAEIVEGILHHRPDALTLLYKNYYPMILKMVINNSGNEDDAKDLYQEALMGVCKKIEENGLTLSSSLRTYIYSVCRRLWLKRLSQLGRVKSTSIHDYEEVIPVDESEIDSHYEREKNFRQMKEALSSLGEPCRTLIESFYLKGLSMQDISDEFGYTNADNAKTQKYKCLQRLKKIFFSLS